MRRGGDSDAGTPVLTIKELAKRWGLDPKTVRAGIEEGHLPAFRIGRRVLIPRAAVERLEQGRGLPERQQ